MLEPKGKYMPTKTKRGRPAEWPDRLNDLLEYPGEWIDLTKTYGIAEGPSSQTTVSHLRKAVIRHETGGGIAPFRVPGQWEFVSEAGRAYAKVTV